MHSDPGQSFCLIEVLNIVLRIIALCVCVCVCVGKCDWWSGCWQKTFLSMSATSVSLCEGYHFPKVCFFHAATKMVNYFWSTLTPTSCTRVKTMVGMLACTHACTWNSAKYFFIRTSSTKRNVSILFIVVKPANVADPGSASGATFQCMQFLLFFSVFQWVNCCSSDLCVCQMLHTDSVVIGSWLWRLKKPTRLKEAS